MARLEEDFWVLFMVCLGGLKKTNLPTNRDYASWMFKRGVV